MLPTRRRLAAAICGLSAAGLSLIPFGLAAAPQLDQRIFKVVTAGDPGTAFVLGPASNGRCVLLTAYHVIKENGNSEPLLFLSPQGKKFSVLKGAFKVSESLDLAFLPAATCESSLQLPMARASAITVSTKVHIKGYPVDQEAVHSVKVLPFTATGRITQYNDTTGYDLNYDAATKPGYSGGPVLNDDGQELLAVHGFTDSVGNSDDLEQREQLRVGGRGVSAPLVYRFLKDNGYTLPRSDKAACLVGIC